MQETASRFLCREKAVAQAQQADRRETASRTLLGAYKGATPANGPGYSQAGVLLRLRRVVLRVCVEDQCGGTGDNRVVSDFCLPLEGERSFTVGMRNVMRPCG